MALIIKINTMMALGIMNVARAVWYKFKVRNGFFFNEKTHLFADSFFHENTKLLNMQTNFSLLWRGIHRYFGWFEVKNRGCPDWHYNPFSSKRAENGNIYWWKISDFSSGLGDIKTLWEMSRFSWVVVISQQSCFGDTSGVKRLNKWLMDWVKKNPYNIGPNWKCGQEAAIRVIHLATALLIFNQHTCPTNAMVNLIRVHLKRIEQTLSYAIAQDNNHATSEAAALFIGGGLLASVGCCKGVKWCRVGRRLLERHAQKLISEDGSFSQHSVNYHRMVLDTYSIVEIWRRKIALNLFSEHLYQRLQSASLWLYQMVSPTNGYAPNLGANDGSLLLALEKTDYRDFRPCLQLASAVFLKKQAYAADGCWNTLLCLFGETIPAVKLAPPDSMYFSKGGYCLMRKGGLFALFNIPRFYFRPTQADALHVDLWLDGENLLRDAGTYSYADEVSQQYFSGTSSHNTIEFDRRDQMPRLSRFLMGAWLKPLNIMPLKEDGETLVCSAGYKDYKSAKHHRTVRLSEKSLQVRDCISGFDQRAILRWRLRPGVWSLVDNRIHNNKHLLKITATVDISRIEIVKGWESIYYMKKTEIPVLEIEIREPGEILTEYRID